MLRMPAIRYLTAKQIGGAQCALWVRRHLKRMDRAREAGRLGRHQDLSYAGVLHVIASVEHCSRPY